MKSDKELNLKAHALLEERGINIEAIAPKTAVRTGAA